MRRKPAVFQHLLSPAPQPSCRDQPNRGLKRIAIRRARAPSAADCAPGRVHPARLPVGGLQCAPNRRLTTMTPALFDLVAPRTQRHRQMASTNRPRFRKSSGLVNRHRVSEVLSARWDDHFTPVLAPLERIVALIGMDSDFAAERPLSIIAA